MVSADCGKGSYPPNTLDKPTYEKKCRFDVSFLVGDLQCG